MAWRGIVKVTCGGPGGPIPVVGLRWSSAFGAGQKAVHKLPRLSGQHGTRSRLPTRKLASADLF